MIIILRIIDLQSQMTSIHQEEDSHDPTSRSIALLITASAGMLILSCGDVSGPTLFTGYDGWVVGSSVGGYGLILHTTNSGDTWTRHGSAASIPDVPMGAVRAVDSLRAWACGAPADGYATILQTNDAGETWKGSVMLATSRM